MLALASPIIDGHALWEIVLVSLAAGAGSAIAFGLGILGLSRIQDGEVGVGARAVDYLMVAFGALYVVAAIVFGLYTMIQK